MATIGLYDIDFYHSNVFSISLPLMKVYRALLNEGHRVIMMKAYEKTGRYNKIIYFKDNPKVVVPLKLNINTDKAKLIGYGFYGESGLTNPKIIETPPDFMPYDLISSKIKNQSLYKSIRSNSFVDWREKDFSGAKSGAGITYINDRDFLKEEDWKELIQHYDNNIEFVNTIHPSNYNEAFDFLNTYVTNKTSIILPFTLVPDQIKEFYDYNGVRFDISNAKNEDIFYFIFAAKIMGIERIKLFPYISNDVFKNNLIQWANNGLISYKEFLKDRYKDTDYYKLSYRILLRQNPKMIQLQDISEHLTF